MHVKLLRYRIQFDSQNLRKLLGEWELYELIIFQLISNAIKFSNAGGCIIIDTHVIKYQDQFLLQTSVIDTGIGINQGKLESIRSALKSNAQLELAVLPLKYQRSNVLGFGLQTAKLFTQLLGGSLEMTSLPLFKTQAKFSVPIKLSTFARTTPTDS